MNQPQRWAIVPTHSRPDDLARLVKSLDDQCDTIVIIDNASDPPVYPAALDALAEYADVYVLFDDEQPPNLSRLWNVGFEYVDSIMSAGRPTTWDVAVFNDDAIVPAGWYDAVAGWHRGGTIFSPAVTHTHTYGDPNRPQRFHGAKSPMDLMERMCPWAYVVRGELGIKSDETMRWWYFDTDFEIRAREAGGVLAVPGPQVVNSKANSSTVGVLAEQAGRDRERFKEVRGFLPW